MWGVLSLCDRLVSVLQQDKADLIRPKRKYEKKPKVLPSSAAAPQQPSPAALPGFSAKDLNQYDFPSSDEEPLSQVNRGPALCTQKRNVEPACLTSRCFISRFCLALQKLRKRMTLMALLLSVGKQAVSTML